MLSANLHITNSSWHAHTIERKTHRETNSSDLFFISGDYREFVFNFQMFLTSWFHFLPTCVDEIIMTNKPNKWPNIHENLLPYFKLFRLSFCFFSKKCQFRQFLSNGFWIFGQIQNCFCFLIDIAWWVEKREIEKKTMSIDNCWKKISIYQKWMKGEKACQTSVDNVFFSNDFQTITGI